MYFREKSVNFISRLEYQEQEREPCAPIFSRVMDFNFVLSSEIALSKVVSVVQERIFGDQNTSVFFLKDLRSSYQDQLEYRGGDEDMIKNVKMTRLTEQLLGKIPLLQEQKKWKICAPHSGRRCWQSNSGMLAKYLARWGNIIKSCENNT